MSSGELRIASPVPTGNTYDKYGTTSPVARRLMAAFERALAELIDLAAPGSILDVGCGEGVLTVRWAERWPGVSVTGLDLPDPRLEAQWRLRQHPSVRFVNGRAEELPFADGEFAMVTAIETLEHLSEVDRALAEMARVARRHLLVSVPREPIWRILNVARGAYVGRLGNTPGHVHHWSRRGLARVLAPYGKLVATRAPFPWSIALVQIG